MLATTAPYQQYFDTDGSPLDAGYVYFGIPDLNPETNPVAVYWDSAGTIPATQPVRTLNGYMVRNGTPTEVFTAGDYSQTVKSSRGATIVYSPRPSSAYNLSYDGNTIYPPGSIGAELNKIDTKLRETLSVKDFGAIGDGITDDTIAIQDGIDALPTGGELFFPPGIYKISSSLLIGDGNASQASTKWGLHLNGAGRPPLPAEMFSGFPSTGGVKLLWAGGASPMIQVRGPLNGWGISNMYLDGGIVATRGIQVVSASVGQSSNLTITNCRDTQLYESTLPVFAGFGLANSMHNAYTNLSLNVPAVAGAKGIVLTGNPTSLPIATNSCYGLFQNLVIYQPSTLATFGIYLQWTDTPTFDGVHIFGGSASSVAVQFDYTLQDNMPSACQFYSIDPSGNGTSIQFQNVGTPGPGARPNAVHGLGEINLGVQPNLPNLCPDLPRQHGAVSLFGQTVPIANTVLFTPYETGIYRVSYYIVMTTGGIGGTIAVGVNYNDSFSAKSQGSPSINANGTAPSFVGGNFTFRASATTAITYSVAMTGVSGPAAYSLSLTIERVA